MHQEHLIGNPLKMYATAKIDILTYLFVENFPIVAHLKVSKGY